MAGNKDTQNYQQVDKKKPLLSTQEKTLWGLSALLNGGTTGGGIVGIYWMLTTPGLGVGAGVAITLTGFVAAALAGLVVTVGATWYFYRKSVKEAEETVKAINEQERLKAVNCNSLENVMRAVLDNANLSRDEKFNILAKQNLQETSLLRENYKKNKNIQIDLNKLLPKITQEKTDVNEIIFSKGTMIYFLLMCGGMTATLWGFAAVLTGAIAATLIIATSTFGIGLLVAAVAIAVVATAIYVYGEYKNGLRKSELAYLEKLNTTADAWIKDIQTKELEVTNRHLLSKAQRQNTPASGLLQTKQPDQSLDSSTSSTTLGVTTFFQQTPASVSTEKTGAIVELTNLSNNPNNSGTQPTK